MNIYKSINKMILTQTHFSPYNTDRFFSPLALPWFAVLDPEEDILEHLDTAQVSH
jgi:hypothetical protein